jgi:bifunctional DNA-binding transcriptional regulator/antitoxin component of YhaV-PrlF toxin-antitoxin module
MKTYNTKVETREESFITFPEELVEQMGWKENQKFTIEEKDGNITMKPYTEVEIDFDDETFMKLAKMAHEQDITFNELCNNILRDKICKLETSLND